jgi:ABC-type uncharacterized transport system involved in gliding motility auxiliary subunit
MKGKFDSLVYSVVGVIAVLIIIVAINLLGGLFKFRSDLTENKLYTLSDGTKKILNKLDTDVVVRFYFSKDNASVPVPLRTYAQEVQDLLDEYQQYSHGKVKVIKLDPKPDSDAEDSANLDGIEGQAVDLTDKIYLGIAVSCLDAKTTIPYLSPDRETLLEYDLSRAISSVANPKKAVIGVMSALPVTGREAAPMMMMQQRQQPSKPWVFLSELKENYVVRDIPLTTDKIDDDVSVLVVVHPQGITDEAQFAIDQFLLRGGKMVALVDPYSFVEAQTAGPYGGAAGYDSTLNKLFPPWGIDFSVTKMIADPTFATQVQRENDVQSDPTILSVTSEGINRQDALGAAVSDLLMPFAGAFTGKPAEGLKEDVLVKSSNQAGLVDVSLLQAGADAIRKQLKSANTAYPIAIRLSGKFKTAFPNGKPEGKSSAKPSPSPTPQTAASAPPAPKEEYLKEAKSEGVVILVGDSDFAYDAIAGRAQQVLTQTVFVPSNGNLNFIQSSVEQLAGDSDLIGIRSRSSGNRPFVVVNKMEAAAQQKYQSKIDELEDNLNQTRQKLAALQTSKQSDQKTLLSPEQQAEIKKFQENEATVNKELKQVRKNLRQEIDSLQNTVKWVDIAGMAVIVTFVGLTLAFVKRSRRAAR